MITDEIKKLLGTDKLVFGTDQTIRQLKQGKISKVFVTTNCPVQVQEDIAQYAKLSGAAIESAGIENEELGIICKRQHAVSVVGVKKAK